MDEIIIRPATPEDAPAITRVHCSTVTEWRHPISGEIVPYEALDRYGCWRNGGPWMHPELCYGHIENLLASGHLALVAEVAGQVVAEAEYYVNDEPPPYGPGLHLSILYVHAGWQRRGVGRQLLEAGVAYARASGGLMLTTQPEAEALDFYRRAGFSLWLRHKEMQLAVGGSLSEDLTPVHIGELPSTSLALRIGRYQNGALGWEALWPEDIPGWRALRRGVWRGMLDGTPVVLALREQLNDPMQADGYAWLPPDVPLTPFVAMLRALAAQKGYVAVDLLLPEQALPELRRSFRLDYQTTVDLWRREVEV